MKADQLAEILVILEAASNSWVYQKPVDRNTAYDAADAIAKIKTALKKAEIEVEA